MEFWEPCESKIQKKSQYITGTDENFQSQLFTHTTNLIRPSMWLIFIPSWTSLDYQILSYECQTTFWVIPRVFHPPNIPFQNKHGSQPLRYWCRHHNLDSRESSCQNRPPQQLGTAFVRGPHPLSFSSFGDPGPCIKPYSLWGLEADCVIDFWNGRNGNK